ncbi:MAG: acyltransferase family protein [Deltaproteobacteria bacterium]|nr:MAG: acyltransferase family protein [Deltaproteobacteria bacterium]
MHQPAGKRREDDLLVSFKRVAKALLEKAIDPELDARIARIQANLNEYGVDPWGFDPRYLRWALPFGAFFYYRYFRVETVGIRNVPEGRVLLIANHSGQIPVDGALIVLSMLFEAEPPRMVRSMVETWVPTLPFVSYFFPRTGQIVGTRDNCRRLLERDEIILAFPEGVRGISKPFPKRYQLERFGLGFMRLALMTGAPIVPTAVVGAEEQIPTIMDFKPLAKALGMPSFPVTPFFPWLGPLGIMPLPVKIRIYYGRPMYFEGDPDDDDEVLLPKVQKVRRTIQRMIRDGLKVRKGIFW